MTYIIGNKETLSDVVPTVCYIKKKEIKTKAHQWVDVRRSKEKLRQNRKSSSANNSW